jgi:hypothetical protein
LMHQILKSLQWYLGWKSWKAEKIMKIVKEPKKNPNTVPWNWTKSVEG